jgi:hypothetical protein
VRAFDEKKFMRISIGGLGLLAVVAVAAPPRAVQLPGQAVALPGQPEPPQASPLSPEAQLEADHEKRRLMLQEINRMNPLAQPSGMPMPTEPTHEAQIPQLTPEQIEQIRKLQALLDNPNIKKYLSVVSDPQVSAEVQQLMKSDRLKHAGIAQVIWILVYFGIKGILGQRLRDEKLAKRLLARFGLFCVFLFVASIVLPSLILGPGYMKILSRISTIVFGG